MQALINPFIFDFYFLFLSNIGKIVVFSVFFFFFFFNIEVRGLYLCAGMDSELCE